MQIVQIPLRQTGQMNPLANDYLAAKPELSAFYDWAPDIEGLKAALEKHKDISTDRAALVKSLQRQYEAMDKGFFADAENKKVAERIDSLNDKNTFTITTGHQLNIFTGPLFFIYKIVSAINYASYLRTELPEYNFVPVYWMASEDHDFEEINHIHLWNKKLEWEAPQGGAVGRMPVESIMPLIDELKSLMRDSENEQRLIQIIENAYSGQPNLSLATRKMVHELFKQDGLIILDADDAELKHQLVPVMQEELLNNTFYSAVEVADKKLSQEYKLIVTPREINFFYLTDDQRSRIVKDGEQYSVLNSDKKWTEQELLKELESQPQNFSPNVVLRPIYQEIILPNLAYIGGNNEIAYWFQLRKAFEQASAFFPQLLVRDSAIILGKRAAKDMNAAEISPDMLLQPLEDLKKSFYEVQELEHPSENMVANLMQAYNHFRDTIQDLPKDLVSGIVRELNLHQKDLKKWGNDIHARQLQQHEKNLAKLEKLHGMIFPNGSFQERYDNFIPYYVQYGEGFFKMLKDNFNPLLGQLHIFTEEV